MISHEEAQALLSARLDGPLDPVANRELLAHLATCPTCQAFAEQSNLLARGLRDLPHLPASPQVSRVVLEHVSTGRSPWARLTQALSLNPSPLAAAAALAVLALVALTLMYLNPTSGDDPPGVLEAPVAETATQQAETAADLSAQATPTEQPTEAPTNTPAPTETPTPTATTVPTVPNITVTEPPATIPEPTPTATATPLPPTATATEMPPPTQTPTATATATETATPEPTETPTAPPEPTPTPEPTATPTPEPTDTPEPTPTEVPTETPTEAPTEVPTEVPTETPTEVPTETPTEVPATPTETPTEVPTETPTPTATATPEPTETPTPEPTETPTPEPTPTVPPAGTPEPADTTLQVAIETPSPTPAPEPTDTPEPTPTATPEAPRGQPTIAPVGNAPVVEDDEVSTEEALQPAATDEPAVDEPTEAAPTDDAAPTIAAIADDTPAPVDPETADPPTREPGTIVEEEPPTPAIISVETPGVVEADEPVEETPVPETEFVDEETPQPEPEPAVEDAPPPTEEIVASAALDLNDALVVASLPLGSGGPLLLAPDGGAVAFYSKPEIESLAVLDFSTGVIEFGASLRRPVWSPGGQYVLVSYFPPGEQSPSLAACDRTAGGCRELTTQEPDQPIHRDVPAGWIDGAAYYQRTFPNVDGEIELRRVSLDSGEDVAVWSASDVAPVSDRPIQWGSGFLIATTSSWLYVDGGGASILGPHGGGEVTRGVIGPSGLIAYSGSGQLSIAHADNPGVLIGAIPYVEGIGSGFAWSPAGDRLVVSDGASLAIYDVSGNQIGSFANLAGAPIGAPLWIGDEIWFVHRGDFTVRRIPVSEALS